MKYSILILQILVGFAVMNLNIAIANAETIFVQSEATQLKSEPKLNATDVAAVKRGEELEVLKTQDKWYQVKSKKKTGWISGLFISKTRPAGAATANDDIKADLSKASRRRSNSYDVAASTRGLTDNKSKERGKDEAKPDLQTLEKIEKQKLNQAEVEKFKKEGELGK